MNRHGAGTIPSRRIPLLPSLPANGDQGADEPQPMFSNNDSAELESSVENVIAVKQMLMRVGRLPIELADIILEHAEYWACSVSSIDYTPLADKHWKIGGASDSENQFLIRTMPLGLVGWSPSDEDAWRKEVVPRELLSEIPLETLQKYNEGRNPALTHPCRKLVFNITSNDQGWGGEYESHGTYRASWTWFDAGLERFDAKADDGPVSLDQRTMRPIWPLVAPGTEEDPSPRYQHELHASPHHKIQANKLATLEKQQHHVEWNWNDDIPPEELEQVGRGSATGNGEFVRSLKLGDIVTVWGRARFYGWQNRIERVEVKMYWAV